MSGKQEHSRRGKLPPALVALTNSATVNPFELGAHQKSAWVTVAILSTARLLHLGQSALVRVHIAKHPTLARWVKRFQAVFIERAHLLHTTQPHANQRASAVILWRRRTPRPAVSTMRQQCIAMHSRTQNGSNTWPHATPQTSAAPGNPPAQAPGGQHSWLAVSWARCSYARADQTIARHAAATQQHTTPALRT